MNATNHTCDARSAAAVPTRAAPAYLPPVDIFETPDEICLAAEVPGARAADIDIQFENGQLTLRAAISPRRVDGARCVACEYGIGDFVRRFELGDQIDPNNISAELVHGVLTVHLPKAAAIKPRKIEVKGA